MSKIYDLYVHFKQGDDLNCFLEKSASVSEGLKMWAKAMRSGAEHVDKLAELLEGKDVECHADTNYIGFCGDDEVLGKAVEMELLNLDDFCGECGEQPEDCLCEEDCEDDCDCGDELDDEPVLCGCGCEDCACDEDSEEEEEKVRPCGCCCSEK